MFLSAAARVGARVCNVLGAASTPEHAPWERHRHGQDRHLSSSVSLLETVVSEIRVHVPSRVPSSSVGELAESQCWLAIILPFPEVG